MRRIAAAYANVIAYVNVSNEEKSDVQAREAMWMLAAILCLSASKNIVKEAPLATRSAIVLVAIETCPWKNPGY